jgi:hypothetical protein
MGSSDGFPPCNPGGASPSLYRAVTRFTGPLFTGRGCLPVRYCGLTSLKSIGAQVGAPRRVERPSPEISTKGLLSSLLPISPLDQSTQQLHIVVRVALPLLTFCRITGINPMEEA